MIRLDSSTTKLQFKTDVAVTTNELSIIVSYSDKTSTQYLGGTQTTLSTGTTLVDICDAPPFIPGSTGTFIRDVDTITINNTDTTSKLIYLYYYDNAVLYSLPSVTLSVGDQLEYTHGDGWKTIDDTGAIKTISVSVLSGITSINVDTTAAQTLTVGTTGTDFAIVDDMAGDHKFNLPDAGAAARGVVSTGAQTIAGAKTFSTAPILSSLTASEILALDGSKQMQTLAVATYPSLAELAYVKGVTSAIQTQMNAKAPIASPTFTGTVTTPAIIVSSETASRVAIIDASKNVKSADTATYPNLTELSYLKGVTSAIQTQLAQQKLIDTATAASFVVTNPADSTTVYIYPVSTLAPNATATNRQFQLPTGVLRRASMMIDATAVLGSSEAITVNLRNITDATSTLLGTVTSDTRGNRTFSGAISIATDSSKYYSVEIVYPAFATNPTSVEWYVTLETFEQ